MTDPCGQCTACISHNTEPSIHSDPWHSPFNRMILCATCGNKRCPAAWDCRLDCTGSNEPNQPGSSYQYFVPDKEEAEYFSALINGDPEDHISPGSKGPF